MHCSWSNNFWVESILRLTLYLPIKRRSQTVTVEHVPVWREQENGRQKPKKKTFPILGHCKQSERGSLKGVDTEILSHKLWTPSNLSLNKILALLKSQKKISKISSAMDHELQTSLPKSCILFGPNTQGMVQISQNHIPIKVRPYRIQTKNTKQNRRETQNLGNEGRTTHQATKGQPICQ